MSAQSSGMEYVVARKPRTRRDASGAESQGDRLARLRKDRGLTQVELAEKLGVTQSFVSQAERNDLRLNSEMIVELTRILRVSADELLGLKPLEKSGGVQSRRLLRRLKEIDALPKRDQQALLRTIDAFIQRAS